MSDTAPAEAVGEASGHGALARLVGLRRAWLGIDRDPAALAFVQRRRGALALHLAFFAVLLVGPQFRATILAASAVVLGACALWPARRMLWIGGAGLLLLFPRPYRTEELGDLPAALRERAGGGFGLGLMTPAAVALFLVLAWGLLAFLGRRRKSLLARRPVTVLLAGLGGLVVLADLEAIGARGRVFLWSLIGVAASALWYLAYALTERKTKDPTPDALRLGFLRPFWGGTPVPTGKGPAFLRRFEAKDSAELAVTRLKALKLAVWAVLLAFAHGGLEDLVHGRVGLPTLEQALARSFEGSAPPLAIAWASLAAHYLLHLLRLAASGHALVALVRMSGFRIPRNTVRPLSSRTLAEFWNRYYYYFKELLVDFFFFPAFLRYFKKMPRVRLAFATFCAAGFGNFLYHFLREVQVVALRGPLEALRAFASYGVYVTVLAGGLIVSQLRKRRPEPKDGFLRYELLPRLNVALFFMLLGVFDDLSGAGTLAQRFGFLFHLVGLHLPGGA